MIIFLAVPKAPEPTGKRERWQLRVIATGEVVGTYVRRESVEDARHHAQRQPSEYEIIELFPEPTGDDNWSTIVEAYPDARIWEHAPDDWQIAAGADGEIKTYGHKTAEAAIATVARRIRAMKAEPKAPDVTEVELPPLDEAAIAHMEGEDHNYGSAYRCRERQLKAEIAAKNRAERGSEVWKETARVLEKERDAALAEVEHAFANVRESEKDARKWEALLDETIAVSRETIAQLQRDLDAAKELLKESYEALDDCGVYYDLKHDLESYLLK